MIDIDYPPLPRLTSLIVSNTEQTSHFIKQWFNDQFETAKAANKTVEQHLSRLRELCRLVLGDAKIDPLKN